MKDCVWAQDPIRNPKDTPKWDKLIETQRIMREDDGRGMKGEESDADADAEVCLKITVVMRSSKHVREEERMTPNTSNAPFMIEQSI